MKYTRQNFDKVCKRILGEVLFNSLTVYGPSKVLNITIIRVWGDMIKLKDEEDMILKRGYNDLKSYGCFQWEE